MRKSRSDFTDEDWQSLKDLLTRALDMPTAAAGKKDQLQALVQTIVGGHASHLVRDCLAEIQRECDEQIALLEHRLGMLVEVQAEISKQRDLPDPHDLLNSYLKRLPR